jgi:hypothetical protein
MNRFVLVKDVFAEMAKETLPAWAKLAINGAVLSEQVELYSFKGEAHAYVPEYAFEDAAKGLIRLKRDQSIKRFIESYELKASDAQDGYVTAWHDDWESEPKRIAVGWVLWHEHIDWAKPLMEHQFLEIDGLVEIFSYDDIFTDGAPDTAPYYDAKFESLCFSLSDAERLLPMVDLEPFAFDSANAPAERIAGRRAGTGYADKDRWIVEQMREDLNADSSLSIREAASRYAERAVGGGTTESKIKRLERRMRE